jgi:hypothetical protein
MKIFLTIVVAIVLALIGKIVGRFYAKTHLTDDTSAVLTVAAHRASLKRVGRVAIVTLIVALLMIALGSLIAPWIKIVGWLPFIVMNCCLGLLAGTAASLHALLERPDKWDAIQVRIDQRKRLIEYLKKFLPVFIVAALVAAGTAHAADACFFGFDVSPSMDVSDAHDARSFLKRTGAEAAATLGCSHVVAVAIGCEVRFAKRAWLDVPVDVPDVDCSKVEAEPLQGHSGFWDHVRAIADSRKEDAVRRCEAEKAARAAKHEAEVAAFAKMLDAAFAVSSPQRCSRITASLRDALGGEMYRAIVIVSDAVDNPPASLDGIVVPTGTRVVFILARPNPAYAPVAESLAHAAALARISGITVVTTAELRPDFWSSAVSGGSR